MCNECVHTLTFEGGSGASFPTFMTFGVPGEGGEGGGEHSATGGHTGGKRTTVDLGNGVIVTATKVVVGDGAGERAPVDVWSKRRAALKAKAAALSSASAGAAVTVTAAAARVAMSTSHALTPANVAKVEAAGVRGGAECSYGRPSKLDAGSDDGDGIGSSKRSKSSSSDQCRGPGSTALNTPEDGIAFFPDDSSGSDTGSLSSASRTSSGIDIDIAVAAAAAAAPLQVPPQQRQMTGVAPSATGVRAMALALERKMAGLADAPTPTTGQETNSETLGEAPERGPSVVVSREESGREMLGGGSAAAAAAVETSLGEEGEEKREEVKTGGSRRRLLYCGVAALGVGLVGAAVWAFGGRPSRR